jgi:hypothetical protein
MAHIQKIILWENNRITNKETKICHILIKQSK